MKRGEIYFIFNDSDKGLEQKSRPAVIVSSDNERGDTVEVVFMTTSPNYDLPTHVLIRSALKPSTLICEQVSTVYKNRIGYQIGELTREELAAMDAALMISLGLDYDKAAPEEAAECEPKEAAEDPKEKITIPVTVELEQTAEYIRMQAERDVYKQLYTDLLKTLRG